MGPALNTRSKEIVAGYASVAATLDVAKIHKEKGVTRFVYPEFGVNLGFPDKQ